MSHLVPFSCVGRTGATLRKDHRERFSWHVLFLISVGYHVDTTSLVYHVMI